MDEVNLFVRFVSLTLGLQVLIWDGQKESLDEFEKQNCFLPKIQPQLTASALELFIEALKEKTIYEIRETLGLRVFLLKYGHASIIIGPFVEEQWDDVKASELMAKIKLPTSYEIPFKLYFCGYPMQNIQTAHHIIYSAIRSLNPGEPPFRHRFIAGLGSSEIHSIHNETPPEINIVEKRYEIENEFLRMVQQGNAKEALAVYQKMSIASTGLYTNPFNIRSALVTATVARTLIRKAVEQAGLQSAIVDSISQSYAQKLNAVNSQNDITKILVDLTVDFSDAVKVMLQDNFSHNVRKAADYIKLCLSKPLTLDEITKVVGISPNYLSHIFKKEVGVSVSQYIADKRCEKAAEMLRTTTLSIQEISTYVGYLDNNYFVKVFKSRYDITPTEYRKQKNMLSSPKEK